MIDDPFANKKLYEGLRGKAFLDAALGLRAAKETWETVQFLLTLVTLTIVVSAGVVLFVMGFHAIGVLTLFLYWPFRMLCELPLSYWFVYRAIRKVQAKVR